VEDKQRDAEALKDVCAALRAWRDVIEAGDTSTAEAREKAANAPEAKAAGQRAMSLAVAALPLIRRCRVEYGGRPSTALTHALYYLEHYRAETESDRPIPACTWTVLAAALTVEHVDHIPPEPTLLEQLTGWAAHLVQDTGPMAEARHSWDFRWVRWFGKDYSFTSTRAAVVKLLWEAWENGTPDVGGDALLDAVGSEAHRLRDVFRGHSAWGEMIVKGATKGAFRLAGDF